MSEHRASGLPHVGMETPVARLPLGAARRASLEAAQLYLVTDDQTPDRDLPRLIEQVVAGGADLVQLRRKQTRAGELLELAQECCQMAQQGGALFFVNDYPELALEAGADGVHVGQEEAVAEVRRRVGPDLLIGVSTHSAAQVAALSQDDQDYLSAGPVFSTPTKPGRPAVGYSHVTSAARQASVPVVAIGGLGPDSVASAIAAGADTVAVVRAICGSRDPKQAASSLRAEIATASRWLKLVVNGQRRKCPPDSSVAQLLDSLAVDGAGVVVEINGRILRAPELAGTRLAVGDRLEIVHFVGGG